MDNAFWERRWTSLRSQAPSASAAWVLPRAGGLDLTQLLHAVPLPLRRMRDLAADGGGGWYLQHDVGRDLDKAVRLAEAEAEAGIAGTYFLLPPGSDGLKSNYYGEWTSSTLSHAPALLPACRRIVELGHDLGLLNNALDLALLSGRQPAHVLQEQVAFFTSHGLTVVGMSEHKSRMAREGGYRNAWVLAPPGQTEAPRHVEGLAQGLKPRPLEDLGLSFDTGRLPRNSWLTDSNGGLSGVVGGKTVATHADDSTALKSALSTLPDRAEASHVMRLLLHPAKWRQQAPERSLTQITDQADADAHAIFRVVDEEKLQRSRTRYRRAEQMIEDMLARGRLSVPTTLLDVGSGAGHWIHYFHTEHGVELSAITAVDIASAALDYVRERFPEVRPLIGDLADPSLDVGGPYDLVTAVGVLHHVLTEQALQQALSTLIDASRQVFIYPLHRPPADRDPALENVKNKRFWTADDYVAAIRAGCVGTGRTVTVDQEPGARIGVVSFDRSQQHVHVYLPSQLRTIEVPDEEGPSRPSARDRR